MIQQQKSNICIFVGPPGSGKGSLSQLCAQEFKVEHLSTGNLCRVHIENQTKIGKKIDFLIKSGKLINDALISAMVCNWLRGKINHICHIIMDGFPRTAPQAKLLSEYLQKEFPEVGVRVLKLSINSTSVVNRLCNRYVCANKKCQNVYSALAGSSCAPKIDGVCDKCSDTLVRRSDDCEEVIQERLRIYSNQEKELLSFFECNGSKVEIVNADRPLKEVFADVKDQLFTV